jgi:hypothetical protein
MALHRSPPPFSMSRLVSFTDDGSTDRLLLLLARTDFSAVQYSNIGPDHTMGEDEKRGSSTTDMYHPAPLMTMQEKEGIHCKPFPEQEVAGMPRPEHVVAILLACSMRENVHMGTWAYKHVCPCT